MSDAENVYILLFKFNGIAVKFVCRVSRVCLFFVSAQVLIVSCLFRSSLVSSAPACVQMAHAIFKAVHIGERKKKQQQPGIKLRTHLVKSIANIEDEILCCAHQHITHNIAVLTRLSFFRLV